MTSLVSIVIAAYQSREFIRTSVEAALAQSHVDLEVVVVDDGSRDGTSDVVTSIPDSRVKLIRQDNSGQSAALNRGAAAARGDYIKFLDADDSLNEKHIESQIAALAGSTSEVASCRWGYFRTAPDISRVRSEVTNRDYANPVDWIVDSLERDEGMMGGWMWLMPRRIWEASGGWNERLTLNNDFDFSIRLLLASSGVRFAEGAVYSYREGIPGALSATAGRAGMESAFLTTESGCAALLARETSTRTKKVCADRWQRWQYSFYPEFPDLARRAEEHVARLGGSCFEMEGGRLLRALLPILGWKRVRRLQQHAYKHGWGSVLKRKTARRLRRIEAGLE